MTESNEQCSDVITNVIHMDMAPRREPRNGDDGAHVSVRITHVT